MVSENALSQEGSKLCDNPLLYRSVVGVLQYATLSRPDMRFFPLNCLIIFIEKKIFNIVYNKIIMQRCQNIKFRRRKRSSSTRLSIILSFILLVFLIYKMLLFEYFLLDKNIYLIINFLFSTRLVNEFEPDKLLQSDNYP
jgi:predicted nucleic acid-binding Zn ribbon protein